MRRFGGVVLVALLGLPLAAQDPAAVLERTRTQLEDAVRRSKLPEATQLMEMIAGLSALSSSPSGLREDGCALIARILELAGRNADTVGVRLSGIEVIALLAEDRRWGEKLFAEVLSPGGSSLRRLGFRAERFLGALRAPAHVEFLLRRVEKGSKDERRLALGALGHLVHREHAPMLDAKAAVLLPLASDEDPELRSRAVLTLGNASATSTLPALFKATRDETVSVRRAACVALGRRIAEPACDLFLGRLIDDATARVREEAVRALAGAKNDTCVPLLVARIAREPLRLRAEIAATLRSLTKVDLPAEAAPWREWLERKRGGKGDGPTDRYGRSTKKTPSYHGIPLRSDRILFVLDVSGSMNYSVGRDSTVPNRIERAKTELSRVLRVLDERSRFGVVFFSQGVAPLSRGLLPATPTNLARALRFVEAQPARGGTDTYGALELAFHAYPELDTIFLLSDGVPSVGTRVHPYGILEKVFLWNRTKGIRIHTVALLSGEMLNPFRRKREDKAAAEHFMRILAEETGGRFVSIRGE